MTRPADVEELHVFIICTTPLARQSLTTTRHEPDEPSSPRSSKDTAQKLLTSFS